MTDARFAARSKLFACIGALAGVALLALPFAVPQNVPLFFLFLGRLHPLVLHFPIVLSLVAMLTELSRRFVFKNIPGALVVVLLGSAALSALVTVGAGYFLYASGDYSGDVIMRHFWGGVIAGAGLLVTFALLLYYRATGRLYGAYFVMLLMTNAAVAYASHLGGTVTHGQDYLTEHLQLLRRQDHAVAARSDNELMLYADMVAPVLEARCISCHNPQRAKGGLTMTRYHDLFGAGDSNRPAVVPGSLTESEAMVRIMLPAGDDERMPPEGKAPLTTDEIALLSYWIKAGASDTSRVWPIRYNDTMQVVVDRLLPELKRYQLRTAMNLAKAAETRAALATLAPALNIVVRPDSLSDDDLMRLGTTVPPHRFTDEHLRQLAPYYQYFSSVSLVSAGLDDDLLYYIAQMTNVRTLYLQKNGIDGSGLTYLTHMPNLEVLNLSFTRVDDRHALELLQIPNLKRVYLYRTNTSPQVIKAMTRYKPGLEILEEEGPYF